LESWRTSSKVKDLLAPPKPSQIRAVLSAFPFAQMRSLHMWPMFSSSPSCQPSTSRAMDQSKPASLSS